MYPTGVVEEHLATRRGAGLFDVSHMGRFALRGAGALPFLQRVLSNNAAALDVGQAQYTLIPTETGGALDDAYLYRFEEDEYLLVVNAANSVADLAYFREQSAGGAGLRPTATACLASTSRTARNRWPCWRSRGPPRGTSFSACSNGEACPSPAATS